MWLNFLLTCAIYLTKGSVTTIHYRQIKHMHLLSKHVENVVKTKMGIRIFLNSFVLQLHWVNSYDKFSSSSIYFFVLCHYFEMERIILFWACILPFSPHTIIGMVLKYTQEFRLLHFRGINRRYVRKSTLALFL